MVVDVSSSQGISGMKGDPVNNSNDNITLTVTVGKEFNAI